MFLPVPSVVCVFKVLSVQSVFVGSTMLCSCVFSSSLCGYTLGFWDLLKTILIIHGSISFRQRSWQLSHPKNFLFDTYDIQWIFSMAQIVMVITKYCFWHTYTNTYSKVSKLFCMYCHIALQQKWMNKKNTNKWSKRANTPYNVYTQTQAKSTA